MRTMRRIRTFIEILYRQFINDLKINIVILCTLIITFSFIFLICNVIIDKYSEYGNMNEAMRTYEIRPSGSNSVKSFDSILNELEQKGIEKITYVNLTVKNSEVHRLNLVFDNKRANLNLYIPSPIEGRDFNNNELAGQNVIILSQDDYSKFYMNYTVGDIIRFVDNDFKLIGIHKEYSMIPYNTLLNISKNNENSFRLNEAFILLKERLDKKELHTIIKSAKSRANHDANYKITTSSSWMLDSIIHNISGSVIAGLVALTLCTFNILNLVKVIQFRNKSLVAIYRVLGYENKYIILNFITIIMILILISVISGIYLSNLLNPVIKEMMSI